MPISQLHVDDISKLMKDAGCTLLAIQNKARDKWFDPSEYEGVVTRKQAVRWTCKNDASHVKETFVNPIHISNHPFCRLCALKIKRVPVAESSMFQSRSLTDMVAAKGWRLYTPDSGIYSHTIKLFCDKWHIVSVSRSIVSLRGMDEVTCPTCMNSDVNEGMLDFENPTQEIPAKPIDFACHEPLTTWNYLTGDFECTGIVRGEGGTSVFRKPVTPDTSSWHSPPSVSTISPLEAMMEAYFMNSYGAGRFGTTLFDILMDTEIMIIMNQKDLWMNHPLFHSFPGLAELSARDHAMFYHAARGILFEQVYRDNKLAAEDLEN